MSDSQNHGLDELGQRLQAMSDPAHEPRLRPFQGAPLPIGPAGGRGPAYGAFEDIRITPPPPPPPVNAPVAQPAPSFGSQYPSQSTSYQASAVSPIQTPPYQPAPPAPDETFPDVLHSNAPNGSYPSPSGFQASGFSPTGYPAPTPTPVPPTPAPPPSNLPVTGFTSTPYPSSVAAAAPPAASPTPAAGSDAPATHALPAPAAEDPNAAKTGLQKAVQAIRSAIPVVQRLLPLLDGNFATVLSSLVTQQPHHPPPPPQVRVDLEPINRGLAEVRDSQRDLKTQLQDQGTSLKRVEDHLERVREATDRNTLEQQELVEDLRSVGSRLSLFAIIGLVLLVLSMGLNIFFLIELQHILR